MGSEAKKKSQLVSLADEDAVKEILVGTVLNLWETVNNLTRLRPSKKERYKVTIFGSARVGRDAPFRGKRVKKHRDRVLPLSFVEAS